MIRYTPSDRGPIPVITSSMFSFDGIVLVFFFFCPPGMMLLLFSFSFFFVVYGAFLCCVVCLVLLLVLFLGGCPGCWGFSFPTCVVSVCHGLHWDARSRRGSDCNLTAEIRVWINTS